MELEVFLGSNRVGTLSHESTSDHFGFTYDEAWCKHPEGFAISPYLPLPDANRNARIARRDGVSQTHIVRSFFENLLPEGASLDAAAAAAKVSKASLVGLLATLGNECMGALRITPMGIPVPPTTSRLLTREELSERIRSRPALPFSVWDGKVRLSIPGYQDKVAVYVKEDQWCLVEGALASTHLIKPEPVNRELSGLTSNEFFCMRLARGVGMDVASVELLHIPEEILVVERFDRRRQSETVERIHVIDGCQALGLPVNAKYERLYGDGRDVMHIREGAQLPHFFALPELSAQPLVERRKLLHWTIFQVLISNADAHAKNLSFFLSLQGMSLAPAYDLVSAYGINKESIADSYAMAIGDAFTQKDLTPYEWALFADRCDLPKSFVSRELQDLTSKVVVAVKNVAGEVIAQGARVNTVKSILEGTLACCEQMLEVAPKIARVKLELIAR